jgi:hypothetical protein
MLLPPKLPAEFSAALADETAQKLRELVIDEVAGCLADNGSRLRFHHWLTGEPAGSAFGAVTEMAAELGSAAAELARAGRLYAASALVRQLLECGYLFDLAAESPEELSRWYRGDHRDLRTEFTPVKLRRRSTTGFTDSEYRTHCERGGHPHRLGEHLLRNPSGDTGFAFWADLALHTADTWRLFCGAVSNYDPRARLGDSLYSPHRSPGGHYRIDALIGQWRTTDLIAQRSARPTGTTPSPRPGG